MKLTCLLLSCSVGTRDAFLHVCGTVSATDRMVLYVSGRQVGSRSAYGLQDVARSRRYLGRGAWSADTGSFVSEVRSGVPRFDLLTLTGVVTIVVR
jgi:hypothetical protein